MYARKVYAETLIKLNEDELKGLDYDFSAFDGAADKISGEHSFCLDLDVFGDRSLFQSLNRTVTGFGRERLASWLSNPLTDKKEIVKRQEAVKELAALSALRQHFYVTGIIRQDTQDTRDNDKPAGSAFTCFPCTTNLVASFPVQVESVTILSLTVSSVASVLISEYP